MKDKYVVPTYRADAFHCPHCGVYAHQEWYDTAIGSGGSYRGFIGDSSISICSHCKEYAIWIDKKMIYPVSSIAPLPVEDMPEDIKEDFMEARKIVNESPRAAAALLRLGLQKLMPHLGEKGKNLNSDIADLVKNGLPEKIQKALDSVRVIGNNAVHPGEIDLKDDAETATFLFELLNLIVEDRITRPKKVDEVYNKLPDHEKKVIDERDNKRHK